MKRRSDGVPVLLGLLVAILIALVAQSEFVHKIELRTLDYRYCFRERYQLASVTVDPNIVLVLQTEETAQRYPEPMALWLPYYADLCAGLGEAGATAIGIDDIISYVDQTQVQSFGLKVLPFRERLVLISFLGENDEHKPAMILPHPILQALVGSENIALANLSRDLDGICRAQQIFPWSFPVPDKKSSWDCLAGLLAQKHTGKKLDASTFTFGDRKIPTLASDDPRMLINYAGSSPSVFPVFTFHDVVDHARKQDQEWLARNFKGKVVLVGRGSTSFQDVIETPFSALPTAERGSGSSMLGISVQASILNTLLTGQTLSRASRLENLLALLVICCLGAFLVNRLPVVLGLLLGVALLLGLPCISLLLFARAGVWVDVAAPTLALPFVWGLVYGHRYVTEARQRHLVQATFGHYLSSELITQLLEDPEKRKIGAGERREITVFFCDINGFTSTSEKLEPQEVVRMLNTYLGEMTRIVVANGGNVEKYIGDAIMASFGAVHPDPQAEAAAVRTAVGMIRRLRELQAADKTGTGGFYKTKVGIHSGPVLFGNIGSRDRMEFTMIGDTVNLAARIMDMTKEVGGEILITDTVYEKVKDMPGVSFQFKEERDIRGRRSKVGLYAVIP